MVVCSVDGSRGAVGVAGNQGIDKSVRELVVKKLGEKAGESCSSREMILDGEAGSIVVVAGGIVIFVRVVA